METTHVLCLKTNKINIENWKKRLTLPLKKKRLFKKSARQLNDQFFLCRCHCKQAFPVISVFVLAFSRKRRKMPTSRWLVTVYWANIRVWTRNSCSTTLFFLFSIHDTSLTKWILVSPEAPPEATHEKACLLGLTRTLINIWRHVRIVSYTTMKQYDA